MKQTKRLFAVLLAVVTLICALAVMQVSAAYENTYTNSGNQRADIIGVAKTQVGYTEGSGNNNKYGSYFGNNYVSWCAYFIVWCARQANISSSIIKTTGWATADDLGVTYKTRGSYTPQSGDIIIFDWSPYNTASPASAHGDHVGLVEYVSNGYVHTIEGNSNDMVRRCSYSLTYSEIKGYGVPNYQNTVHTHSYKEGYEAAHPHRVYMKCSCGDYYYTGATTIVSGCSDCLKPTNVTLSVDRTTLHQWQTITFESNAANVDSYAIGIDLNGNRIVTQKVPHFFYYKCEEAGNYTAYISARNSYGYTDSAKVKFTVTPHTYDNGKTTKTATCSAQGKKTYTCTVSGCNATKTESIPINASNHVNTKSVAATASTCTVKGYTAGVYCNDCKKYISGHAEQPLAAHKTELRNQKNASCTAAGYSGDQVCTVCGQTITKGSTVTALGHTDPDKDGNCTRCGTHIKDVANTPPSTPSQPQPSGGCRYCGQTHSGPFGWLIQFFHNILAIFKR